MEPDRSLKITGSTVKKQERRHQPIKNLFLLDVLRDKDSRPAFIYAFGTLLIGMLLGYMLGCSLLPKHS